jgi:hypothetical protein
MGEDASAAGAHSNNIYEPSEPSRADELRMEAARCRRLTNSVLDRKTIDTLQELADEYEAEAERLSRMN